MYAMDFLNQLPVETLAAVLRYLTEDELRRAAAISRHLRAVAFANAGLNLRFSYQMHILDPEQRKQNALRAVIDYARSESLPLDLSVYCFFIPTAEQTAVIATCLSHVLPHLVKLTLVFFHGISPTIYASLCQPALHLRELSIRGAPDRCFDAVTPPTAFLPAFLPLDLFGGSAPCLATLELHDLFLNLLTPTPAFRHIRHLTLTYASAIPRLNIAVHFPAARTLEIRCEPCSVLPGESPALDFRNSTLDRLTLEAEPSLMREFDHQLFVSPHVIPLIRRYCDAESWDPSQASDRSYESEPLNVRMRRSAGDKAEAAVISAVSKACRVYWFDYYADIVHGGRLSRCPPLSELRLLAGRIVYVRLDTDFISELLDFGCTMPALRRLMLDLDGEANALWPPYHVEGGDFARVDFTATSFDPDSETLYDLPCPALDVLSIVATDEDAAGVSAREVAHLGQALGQAARAPDKRARLELHGAELDAPVSRDLLARVFSSCVRIPFTIDDPDGSLWAPCFD